MKPIPIDEILIQRARRLCTGANIHNINVLKSAYRGWSEKGNQEKSDKFRNRLIDLLNSIEAAQVPREKEGS